LSLLLDAVAAKADTADELIRRIHPVAWRRVVP
jgi:hypothetical protein